MTYFEDLSGELIKKVGWLEAPKPFARGEVSPSDVALLERLVVHSWKPPFQANGWHDCSLCGRKEGDGPLTRIIEGQRTLLGVAQIYVPDGELMYEAPTLILHYIEKHRYLPPAPFLEAVRRTDPHSAEYHRACDRMAAAASRRR